MLRQSLTIAVVSCIVGIAVGHRAAAVFAKVQPSESGPECPPIVIDYTKPIVLLSDEPPFPTCLHINVTHAVSQDGVQWDLSAPSPSAEPRHRVQFSASMANGQRVSLFAQSNQ